MAQLTALFEEDALNQALEESMDKKVLLFKHSTTCPISARAFKEYENFLAQAGDHISCYLVKVIEDRPVSNEIERITGVKHESPQLIIMDNKQVAWHASHDAITEERIKKAL